MTLPVWIISSSNEENSVSSIWSINSLSYSTELNKNLYFNKIKKLNQYTLFKKYYHGDIIKTTKNGNERFN